MTAKEKFDVIIAGAGVIGLALAHTLARSSRFTGERILLLEQEPRVGQHISSRHSEVIHAGIYYPQDSLKARLCIRGNVLLYEFCDSYNVTYNKIGKLLILNDKSRDGLDDLKLKAEANGVLDLDWWEASQIESVEPALRARYALFSPSTGIIDSHRYMETLLELALAEGVVFAPMTQVSDVIPSLSDITVRTRSSSGRDNAEYEVDTEIFINAAGLGAQQLAAQTVGLKSAAIPALHPCKGDYFSYQGKNPFSHLIYPLPEKNLQGLGIHSTQDLAGQLRFGPDSTYVAELDYSVDPGKAPAYAEAISAYFPAIRSEQLVPDYAGIRPKIAGPGDAAADFKILGPSEHGQQGMFHLFGIESPGLTSSLALAEYVLDLV